MSRVVCLLLLGLVAPLGAQTGLDGAYGLLSEGRVAEGRVALMEAAAALAPSAAVPHLKVARVIGRLDPELQPQVARLAAAAFRGRSTDAIEGLDALAQDADPVQAPALLALAAALADGAEEPARAEALRVRLIESYPEARERVDAVLEVAEARAARGEGLEEAAEWVEALIVAEPSGALTPQARRVLERLRSAG